MISSPSLESAYLLIFAVVNYVAATNIDSFPVNPILTPCSVTAKTLSVLSLKDKYHETIVTWSRVADSVSLLV